MRAKVLGLSLLLSALCAQPVFATTLLYAGKTSGDPACPSSWLYGYMSTGDGPGDDAFQKCLDLCENGRFTYVDKQDGNKQYTNVKRPMLLIWGKDNCSTCSAFCQSANTAISSFPSALRAFYMINSYFRGTSPASEAAKNFFINNFKEFGVSESNIGCHRMGLYGVYEDGTPMKKLTSLPTDAAQFQNVVMNWKSEWQNAYSRHLWTPPRASAGFAAKDGTMKASAATEQVYVPFIRTNNTAAVENNWLQVKYPDNTVTNIAFTWESNVRDSEVLVQVAGKCDVGQSIQLVLLNTNQVAVATNHITGVAAPENSATFPSCAGANGLNWGEWTLDYAAATAKVLAAGNAYTLVVNGGIVWDDAVIALSDSVFSSADFKAWCTSEQVALVCLDKAEPRTGASLFSYSVASNGNSGASFMSMNGLTAAQGMELAAQAEAAAEALGLAGTRDASPYQIALVRADGTICGYLRPQYNADGTCDLAENMARLGELLAQSADEVEAANDTPAGADVLACGGEAKGTLSVNDTVDFFMLSGDCGGKDIVFDIMPDGEVAECAYPDAVVYRYDKKSGEYSAVDAMPSIFAKEGVRYYELVYSVSQDDIDNGRIFVAATAYADPDAEEAKLGGASSFGYTLSVRDATPNPGLVTFAEHPDTAVIQTVTDQVFEVPLYRMLGKTGVIGVTVSIDETLTTATGRFEFTETNVVWEAGEVGVKYVPVTLKGSELNDGLYDITLRIDAEAAMADVEKYFTTYTISYGKEPTEEGQLSVKAVTPAASVDGRIYVRYGSEGDGSLRAEDTMSVQVNRTGGKGPAAAYVSWKNGKETSKETLAWANYLTGTQTAFLSDGFPAPGKTGYTDVTITVTSSNSVSVPVVKDGATIKVRVLPYDAPPFGESEVSWSGIQYTTTDTNVTALAIGEGMKVKSLVKISGSVPAGLKVSIDTNGTLAVTGASTAGTATTTATYWVTLTRDGGGTVCSLPVTVTFENKALADVNPGFTSARSWTGLPLLSGAVAAQRLMGLLDLAVSQNGKTSARYRMAGGKTVSFSASGLAGVGADGSVKLGAKKSVKIGGVTKEYVLSATLGVDGSLEATVTDGEEAVSASAPTGAAPWSNDNTAERFGGSYVAAFPLADAANADVNTLCVGAAALQLKCSSASAWKKGAVTFAGTLPNGKSVSGTATFVPVASAATSATLPIFSSSSADTFSAMVDIDGAGVVATQGVTPYWRHDEGGIEELSYENDYDVVGAAWSRAAWLECFGGTFNAKSAFGASFNLNMTSGIAAGTMREDIAGTGRLSTLQWKGVALPGDPPERPCILGACWYSVSMPYKDASGRDRKRTVKAGQLVELR